MLAKVNELKSKIEQVCSSVAAPAPAVRSPYSPHNWTTISKSLIGPSKLQNAGTSSYTIPSDVPSSAREVLVYVSVRDGSVARGPKNDVKIYTQIGITRYEKYIILYSCDVPGFKINSDNMWFPMPTDRRVYLTLPQDHSRWVTTRLYVIGYR